MTLALRDKTRITLSSSLIRWLVECGRMVDAHLCLDRPYALRGQVVEGDKRGRELGYPTANLDTEDQQLPADGIYAASAEIDGRRYLGGMSIGVRPVFGSPSRTVEVHLLDYQGELYGRTIEVSVHRWLRDEMNFPDPQALTSRMEEDLRRIRRFESIGMLNPADSVEKCGAGAKDHAGSAASYG